MRGLAHGLGRVAVGERRGGRSRRRARTGPPSSSKSGGDLGVRSGRCGTAPARLRGPDARSPLARSCPPTTRPRTSRRSSRRARRARRRRARRRSGSSSSTTRSPDGTGAIADRLAAAHRPRSRCCTGRARRASGRAYLGGLRAARWTAARATCCEMDADFSHDPADLARLLDAGARRAPTSRSARATSPAAGSPTGAACGRAHQPRRLAVRAPRARRRRARPHRRLQVLPRARRSRRSTSRRCRSHGYAFQVELTYRALCAGVDVVEVPIVFRDRRRGESKMSWRIALEAAWLVPALRRSARARCATGDRRKLRPPRADAMSDEPSHSSPSSRAATTRAPTLGAGTRDRWRVARPRGRSASLAVSAALLLRRLGDRATASRRTRGDRCSPASTRRSATLTMASGALPQLARARAARAAPASPASSPAARSAQVRAPQRPLAPRPRARRPAGDRLRRRRDALLARHQAYVLGSDAADLAAQLGMSRRRCCMLGAAPPRAARADRALPAARRLARRQPPRRLDELLAATS